MTGFRDIEQLSAYLDGQLSPSDSARLKSRLQSDRELASAFDDLRSARGILRKVPSRKAPRNFTLTRSMVGLKPPLPQSYPIFRFATALATILFALTVAVNGLAPRIRFGAAGAAYENYGSGGGCGNGCGGGPATILQAPFSASTAATEAPAATQVPAAAMIAPTQESAPAADSTNAQRMTETPSAKQPAVESPPQATAPKSSAPIPALWEAGLLIVSVLGALGLFLMNQFAKRKWK